MDVDIWRNYSLLGGGRPQPFPQKPSERSQRHRAQSVLPSGRESYPAYQSSNTQRSSRVRKRVCGFELYDGSDEESSGTDEFYTPNQGGPHNRMRSPSNLMSGAIKRHQSEQPTSRFPRSMQHANTHSLIDENRSSNSRDRDNIRYARGGGANRSIADNPYSDEEGIGQNDNSSIGYGKSVGNPHISTSRSRNNLQPSFQTLEPRNDFKDSRAALRRGADGAISLEKSTKIRGSIQESPGLDSFERTSGLVQTSRKVRAKSTVPTIFSDAGDIRTPKRQASSQLLASQPKRLQLKQSLWPNPERRDSSPDDLSEFPQVHSRNAVQHATNSYRKVVHMTPPDTKPSRSRSAALVTPSGHPSTQAPKQTDLSDEEGDDSWEASYLKSKKSQLKVACSPYHTTTLPTKSVFAKKESASGNFATPSSRSREPITIDLDTPENEKDNKPTRQFLPSNYWTSDRRNLNRGDSILVKSSSRVCLPDQDFPQLRADVHRQKQAAELIVAKEHRAQFEETQQAIFGEVLPETEQEKQEREQAQRIKKRKARELEEKKRAAEEEVRRKRDEERAAKLLEKKLIEQRDKEQREVERKARLAKERERQAQVELNLAKKRREDEEARKQKAAIALKEKEEREKKEADEKRKENEILRLKLELQQRDKLLAAQSAQKLVPAKISKTKIVKPSEAAVPSASVILSRERTGAVDDDDELFVPNVQPEPRAPLCVTSSPNSSDFDYLFGESTNGLDEDFLPDAPSVTATETNTVDVWDIEKANTPEQPQEENQPTPLTQGPASVADIFAQVTAEPQKGKETERDEHRQEILRERTSQARLGRVEPAPVSPSADLQFESGSAESSSKPKPPNKNVTSKQSSEHPMAAVSSTKLIPLHPMGNQLDSNQPSRRHNLVERAAQDASSTLQYPAVQRSTDATKKPETVMISAAQAIELEERRGRIEAEAQAKKNASKREREEANRKKRYHKSTIALRKRHEAILKEKALKEGRSLTANELQDEVDKFIAKRDRDNERRWQQKRGIESPSTGIAQNISSPAQECQSPSSEMISSQNEDDGPEAIARKEREAEAAALLERMQKSSTHNNRFSRTANRQALQQIVTDTDSDESEEDPDDEEELADMRAQIAAKKAAENDPIKPVQNRDDDDSDERYTDEEVEVPQPIPYDSGTQIPQSLPDMTSSFRSTVTQNSGDGIDFLAAQSRISKHPAPETPASSSAEYKMVNVYYVMSQEFIDDYEDTPKVLNSFLDLNKANKSAQGIVNGHRTKKNGRIGISEIWDTESEKYSAEITHNKSKTTSYYIKTKSLRPEDIEKYDPTEVKPKVANTLWVIASTTITRKNDPITNTTKEREVVTLPSSRVYTVLDMANHDACEYFLEQIKPRVQDDDCYHRDYEEDVATSARTGRDEFNREGDPFCVEGDTAASPWVDFDAIEVRVEKFETIGPIN